ncbi:MAG: succinyl-diaminopimelate desuccinylase [Pseudomonadota bacterium]|jgi:succinyl-diaminopimelate desuccinylase
MSAALDLARTLIRRPSLTPNDAGCQALLGERLAAQGFTLEPMRFGAVDNLWARRGTAGPLFVFAGHTDVVPTGDRGAWSCDPFAAELRDGLLIGRGAADMKGALAAMVVAVERFLAACPQPAGSIGFLITSDEEGDAVDGTGRVMDALRARGERIDWCLVGEPSSDQRLGDVLRIGRRGSLTARLRVLGVQGHVAYPERALNPIHAFAPTLAALCGEHWGGDDAAFPPVSFQVSNVHAGTGAGNVIPGELVIDCNFRFPPRPGAEALKARFEAILAAGGARCEVQWTLGAQPFLTQGGRLVDAVRAALDATLGVAPTLSTGGGTSDGRFIAPTGAEVVELGLRNASIHKIDECTPADEIDQLADVYEALLQRLLGGGV